jgi:enamine deaminase RidA (YjgF/YER057c/UK114 family)
MVTTGANSATRAFAGPDPSLRLTRRAHSFFGVRSPPERAGRRTASLGVFVTRAESGGIARRSSHSLPWRSMTRRLISSGSTFEEQIGYSRAVVAGDWVFVSGTTGFDYTTMSISGSLLQQTEQCLKNIESALRQAGSSLEDVVRVTYVLPNGAEFEQCWPVLRRYFGEVRPAAMMISAGLADPRIKIEIEVTALKRS